jgi:hypothetical protein
MQKSISSWGAYHADIALRHAAFSQLPRQDRERAFQIVRAAKGSKIVTIEEMMLAYEKMHSS